MHSLISPKNHVRPSSRDRPGNEALVPRYASSFVQFRPRDAITTANQRGFCRVEKRGNAA